MFKKKKPQGSSTNLKNKEKHEKGKLEDYCADSTHGADCNRISDRCNKLHWEAVRMRLVNEIIIHCSAVKPNQTSSAKQIDAWHRNLGWNGIGYHYVVRRDGTIEVGRKLSQIGAHCKGHNAHSIGVCYEGGLDADGKPADTRTEAQKVSLLRVLKQLKTKFPSATIRGHCDFSTKSCPCYDATSELSQLNYNHK